MILLLVLVLLVVGVAMAGALGGGALLGTGRSWTSLPLFVGAAVLVVVVLAAAALFGRPGGSHDDGPARTPATTTATAPAATLQPPRAVLPAEVEAVPTVLPRAVMEASRLDRFSTYRVVDGLEPGSTVRVEVSGFDSFERAAVRQCVLALDRATACGPSSPVQFDEQGNADFQVLVHDSISPGRCRVGQPTCLLRVTGVDSGRQADIQTVFVDRWTPGRVSVQPARDLAAGGSVEVVVTGYPAGATATVVLCAPPAAYDARGCEALPAPATFTVGGDGSGRVGVAVGPARLGYEAVACGPRSPCALAVVVGPGFVAAPATPVSFSQGPGASYDPKRLATGLAVAIALLAGAVLLARRTDWTKPRELATPEVDAADLQVGASLDELFGTDAELEERDPIPW